MTCWLPLVADQRTQKCNIISAYESSNMDNTLRGNFKTVKIHGSTNEHEGTLFMSEIPRSISTPFLINELTSKDPDLDQDPTPFAAERPQEKESKQWKLEVCPQSI